MKKIKISFSREVAETLGLESAVILELFNQNLLDNSSYDDLVTSINKNANYLDEKELVMIGCRLMKRLKLLVWQKYQASF